MGTRLPFDAASPNVARAIAGRSDRLFPAHSVPIVGVFPVLPRREELLEGLLGADLLAFQTHGHLQQFRATLLRVLGMESKIAQVDVGNRPVRLEALPIGIAPEEYTSLLKDDAATAQKYAEWVERYSGRKILLAVDRLDYTKGVPERLRAYEYLLRSSPDLKDKITLIQIAVPTREGIDTYQDLRTEVNRLVGEINGKFGTPGWTPLIYINRSIERTELVASISWRSLLGGTPSRRDELGGKGIRSLQARG